MLVDVLRLRILDRKVELLHLISDEASPASKDRCLRTLLSRLTHHALMEIVGIWEG